MEESREALEEGPVLVAFPIRDILGLGAGGLAGGGAGAALGVRVELIRPRESEIPAIRHSWLDRVVDTLLDKCNT